ncbi:MAG: DUF349 domain-containing protein [Desulfobacterales bacterium]
MALTDFMKPRWKHSNPEIRLRSVQEMGAEDRDLLQEIAITDSDPRVRIEAIGRITDENFLRDFAASRGDSEVIRAAGDRLHVILRENMIRAKDTQTRKNILAQIADPQVLAAIACEADDPDIRLAAAEKIQDPQLLCFIAENNCGLKTGLAIVEKLSDPVHLVRVSEKASNKKVKKQAREKLERLTEKKLTEKKIDAVCEQSGGNEAENLCIALENLRIAETGEKSESILSDARAAWKALDPELSRALNGRFEKACERMEAEMAKREAVRQLAKQAEEICIHAETLCASMPENGQVKMNELVSQWEKIGVSDLARDMAMPLVQRFEQARASCRQNAEKRIAEEAEKEEKLRHAQNLRLRAEELSQNTEWIEAEEKWKQLQEEWDRAGLSDADGFLANAHEKWLGLRKEYEENLKIQQQEQEKRLLELCEFAEAAFAAEERTGLDQQIRTVQQEWRAAGSLIPEIKNELTPRFRDACDRFFARQREYWENVKWERWANQNQKEELCALAEIAAQSGEIQGMAEIIREAQKKWKSIGPVPKEKSDELWQRFSKACDAVFQRCLAEKTKICGELREMINAASPPASGEENGNPPEDVPAMDTAEKIKEIQARWNAIGSLPLGLEKDLRQEFQQICNVFFENRRMFYQKQDLERQQNLKIKTRICEKAELLSGSADWNRTAGRLRELQRQWKETGPVPKDKSDDLWQRFRMACDTFFDRMKLMEPENLRKKEELCAKAEELARGVSEENMEKSGREFVALQKKWKAIGPVPADRADEIWDRFHKPCDEFFARHREYMKQRESERAANQAQKEELLRQAEELADSVQWKETGDRLREIQQAWREIGSASRKAEQEMWTRLRAACDSFFTRRKAYFEEQDRMRLENLKKKEWLCLSLETLARLVLPEKSLPDHSAVFAAEHLSIGLEYRETVVVPGNPKATWERTLQKVRDIQKEWKSIGPVPQEKDEETWKRFRAAADIFFAGRQDGGDTVSNQQTNGEETENA